MAGINAFASVTKRKQADLSLSMPLFFNGFAAETSSSSALKHIISENDGQFPSSVPQNITSRAVNSFLYEPTASESIAIIALSKPDETREALMQKAHDVSRREQLITGWLIANSSNQNNVDDLLNLYDISIRTKTASANILLPVMANALADENFIDPFYTMLAKNPPWASRFWRIVSTNAPSAKNAVKLRKKLFNVKESASIYSDETLIKTLAANYLFDEAVDLRSHLLGNTKAQKQSKVDNSQFVINHDFSSKPQYPPIDWQIYSNGEYGAAISNNSLYLSAIQNSGGIFARQLIYLATETYTVKINMETPVSNGNNVSFQLICAEKKERKPTNIVIPLQDKKTSRSLNNKQGLCNYYWLNINARASDNSNGLDMVINSMSIKKVSS